MKKLMSCLIITVLMVNVCTFFAFAGDTEDIDIGNKPSYSEEELISVYMNDPEFQKYLEADYNGAISMLDDVVSDTLEGYKLEQMLSDSQSQIMSYSGTVAYVNMTLVQQINNYYCGPASALMAITAWGGTVSGSTNSAKQNTLANQMGTTSTDGTGVYNLRTALNNYNTSYKYNCYLGTTLTAYLFKLYVFSSLGNNRAPVLHAYTEYLPYYNGNSYGHYMPIASCNSSTGIVVIYDPHINNSYYGIHPVDYTDAFEAISNVSGRYLIANWD